MRKSTCILCLIFAAKLLVLPAKGECQDSDTLTYKEKFGYAPDFMYRSRSQRVRYFESRIALDIIIAKDTMEIYQIEELLRNHFHRHFLVSYIVRNPFTESFHAENAPVPFEEFKIGTKELDRSDLNNAYFRDLLSLVPPPGCRVKTTLTSIENADSLFPEFSDDYYFYLIDVEKRPIKPRTQSSRVVPHSFNIKYECKTIYNQNFKYWRDTNIYIPNINQGFGYHARPREIKWLIEQTKQYDLTFLVLAEKNRDVFLPNPIEPFFDYRHDRDRPGYHGQPFRRGKVNNFLFLDRDLLSIFPPSLRLLLHNHKDLYDPEDGPSLIPVYNLVLYSDYRPAGINYIETKDDWHYYTFYSEKKECYMSLKISKIDPFYHSVTPKK